MISDSDIVPRINTMSDSCKQPSMDQAPYLLYFGGSKDNYSSDDIFTFFSIRTGSCFHRRIPALCGKLFIGSQHGWLATVNRCELSLFNPITEEEIILPSLTTLSNIRTSYNKDGTTAAYFYCQNPPIFDKYSLEELRGCLSFQKVVVSSEPSSSSHSFDVAAIVGWPQYIAIARAGQSNWTLIDDEHYVDLSFYKDGRSIICLTCEGAACIIKFHDESIIIEEIATCLPKEVFSGHKYIAHDDQGEIFKILRESTIEDRLEAGVDTFEVRVLKLTTNDKEVKSTWSVVKSLDGRAIFLGANDFLILSIEEVHGMIQPNCVYFTDDWWDVMTEGVRIGQRDLIVYNLQYDSIDRIICR